MTSHKEREHRMAMAKTSGHDLGYIETPNPPPPPKKIWEDEAKADAIALFGTWACNINPYHTNVENRVSS